jgi:hypothetical protein
LLRAFTAARELVTEAAGIEPGQRVHDGRARRHPVDLPQDARAFHRCRSDVIIAASSKARTARATGVPP